MRSTGVTVGLLSLFRQRLETTPSEIDFLLARYGWLHINNRNGPFYEIFTNTIEIRFQTGVGLARLKNQSACVSLSQIESHMFVRRQIHGQYTLQTEAMNLCAFARFSSRLSTNRGFNRKLVPLPPCNFWDNISCTGSRAVTAMEKSILRIQSVGARNYWLLRCKSVTSAVKRPFGRALGLFKFHADLSFSLQCSCTYIIRCIEN